MYLFWGSHFDGTLPENLNGTLLWIATGPSVDRTAFTGVIYYSNDLEFSVYQLNFSVLDGILVDSKSERAFVLDAFQVPEATTWLYGAPVAADGTLGAVTIWNGTFTEGDGKGNDLVGTEGLDQIFGKAGRDVIHGLGGDDLLHGGKGNDRMFGDTGADKLWGDAGDDVLTAGGTYAGALYGGDGDDVLRGGSTIAETLDGGDGDDRINGGSGGGDFIWGRAGDDVIHAGNSTQNQIYGGAGRDIISGAAGGFDGFIHGDGGNDRITTVSGLVYGDAGRDVIRGVGNFHGGTGKDRLIADADKLATSDLYGEEGVDTFVIRYVPGSRATGAVVIWDFEAGEKIDLSQTPITSLDDFDISALSGGTRYAVSARLLGIQFSISVHHDTAHPLTADDFLF